MTWLPLWYVERSGPSYSAPTATGPVQGALETPAVSSNNNTHAWPSIGSKRIKLSNNQSMHLPAGVYDLTKIDVSNSSRIAVGGPVKIFVNDKLLIQNGSMFNAGGHISDVSFYVANGASGANKSDKVDFYDRVEVRGTIYAPFAEIEIYNNTKLFGWIWGDKSYLHDRSTVYFDTALGSGGGGSSIAMESWRSAR